MAISLGVIGCGYGRSVLVPAFRADPRCDVVVIAARDQAHAERAASELGVPRACSDWRLVTEDQRLDAVVVAAPPAIQPEIVLSALREGKAVFAEKPMALNFAEAEDMANCAVSYGRANMIDFNFTEIRAWKHARQILIDGGIGAVRHVAVHWQVENYVNRLRLANWKSSRASGGGTLFNFVSHCLHYLEWFLGPVAGLSSRLFRMPHDERTGDTTVAMAFSFQSEAAGSLSASAAAYLGSGHRVEFYGEEGTLVLDNSTLDYMKGFRVLLGRRRDSQLQAVAVDDPEEMLYPDSRILPTSRLARRFLDWAEKGIPSGPDFREGLRVQKLLDAALRSHASGCWVETVV
jgi:predicted dehydrogenase